MGFWFCSKPCSMCKQSSSWLFCFWVFKLFFQFFSSKIYVFLGLIEGQHDSVLCEALVKSFDNCVRWLTLIVLTNSKSSNVHLTKVNFCLGKTDIAGHTWELFWGGKKHRCNSWNQKLSIRIVREVLTTTLQHCIYVYSTDWGEKSWYLCGPQVWTPTFFLDGQLDAHFKKCLSWHVMFLSTLFLLSWYYTLASCLSSYVSLVYFSLTTSKILKASLQFMHLCHAHSIGFHFKSSLTLWGWRSSAAELVNKMPCYEYNFYS